MWCERATKLWMYITALSHRAEASRDRLCRFVPSQSAINGRIRMIAMAVTLWSLVVRKVVFVVFEQVPDASNAPLASFTRGVVFSIPIDVEQIIYRPTYSSISVTSNGVRDSFKESNGI